MGRLSAIVLLAIVAAAVILALQAPASWVANRLSGATGDAVQIVDTKGTVWDGEGTLASPDRRWSVPVAWRIAPAALLRGTVELELKPQAGRETPTGMLAFARGSVDARDLVIDVPATVLERGFRAGAPLSFGGDLRLSARDLALQSPGGRGQLDVVWTRARLAAADGTTVDLGEVRGNFEPRGATLVGRLENLGGSVALAGALTLPLAGGTTALDATLVPRADAPASTTRVLSALGAPGADGGVRLQWRSDAR